MPPIPPRPGPGRTGTPPPPRPSSSSSTRTSSASSLRPAHLPHPSTPFYPVADTTTYKDLLLFEERLKLNARMLGRRKRRYEAFLISLILSIITLAHRTVFRPSSLQLLNSLLKALLAVALVTLVLFFASGMYQERIVYANKYVPHANRQLRSINMFLNMRRRGRGGGPGGWVGWGRRGWGRLFGDPVGGGEEKGTGTGTGMTVNNKSMMPSNTSTTNTTNTTTTTTNTVIPPIPPTTNPRGELIFSSRVSPQFKEGYERYRAAFERRRTEKFREERWKRSWFFVRWFLTPPNSVVTGVGGTMTGTTSGPTLRRGGSGLSVRTEGGRSRSTSPAMVGTNPLARSSGQDIAPPPHLTPSPQPPNPTSRPVIEREPSDSTERNRRDRSESYTFILGSSEVGSEGSGLGLESGQDGRRRSRMGKVDEEAGVV